MLISLIFFYFLINFFNDFINFFNDLLANIVTNFFVLLIYVCNNLFILLFSFSHFHLFIYLFIHFPNDSLIDIVIKFLSLFKIDSLYINQFINLFTDTIFYIYLWILLLTFLSYSFILDI